MAGLVPYSLSTGWIGQSEVHHPERISNNAPMMEAMAPADSSISATRTDGMAACRVTQTRRAPGLTVRLFAGRAGLYRVGTTRTRVGLGRSGAPRACRAEAGLKVWWAVRFCIAFRDAVALDLSA